MNQFAIRAYAFLLVLLTTCGGRVFSAELECKDDQSIARCAQTIVYDHIQELRATSVPQFSPDEAVDESKAIADANATEKVKADQAGTSSGGSQAKSTVTDLLPWLNMLGLLSDSDDSDGSVAIDLNFLLPWQSSEEAKHNSQLKWSIDISPQPFEPLVAAIPEDVRDGRKKELTNDIDDTADSELQFVYSVVNDSLGRDFRRHQRRIAALIAPLIFSAGKVDDEEVRRNARSELDEKIIDLIDEINSGRDEGQQIDGDTPIGQMSLTEDQRDRLNAILLEARNKLAPAMARRLDAIKAVLDTSGAEQLAELVLQQPQLLITANRRFRDEVVGPESWGFKITYERSFASLSNFFDTKGRGCKHMLDGAGNNVLALDSVQPCLGQLKQYLSDHTDDLENESRWKMAIEYKKTDHWHYEIPEDSVALDRPKFDRVIASAGFGRAIPRSATKKDRIDFEASYDSNLDGDDSYKSRLVVNLTYTRRIGEFDVPFSVVYANKSEFLEGTDKQIGIHVGLKFRALDKAP